MVDQIMTVTGPIAASDMGLTLPHEHIMTDFIGADKTGKHRYDNDEVIETMKPFLEDTKKEGVKTFVDCTPMFLGRDVNILKQLSKMTGINIVTNTGQYKEPFLPQETFTISAKKLAEQWIREYDEGIEGTDIKPGFIKTAVEPGQLNDIEQKIIKAAAITSKNTGLTIATHTACGQAAREIVDIITDIGVDPSQWIFVHAQMESDYDILVSLAKEGVWIELDGIGSDTHQQHKESLFYLLEADLAERILLSQDAGWYHVGEENGGEIRPFTHILTSFLPELKQEGISQEVIEQIMIRNPAAAYAIG